MTDAGIKTYTSRDKACKAQGKVSLFATLNGACSQTEVRQLASGEFVGGQQGHLAKHHATARIVAQYSAGYFINPRD